jgi:hypothetical protein
VLTSGRVPWQPGSGSATLNLRGSYCGDSVVSDSEVCDDGNTIDESSFPSGIPSCTTCNATCTSRLILTGARASP